MNFVATSFATTTGYTLLSGIKEMSDPNLMLKSTFPKDAKVNITIDDNRVRSNLITDLKKTKFIEKSLFYTIDHFLFSWVTLKSFEWS